MKHDTLAVLSSNGREPMICYATKAKFPHFFTLPLMYILLINQILIVILTC